MGDVAFERANRVRVLFWLCHIATKFTRLLLPLHTYLPTYDYCCAYCCLAVVYKLGINGFRSVFFVLWTRDDWILRRRWISFSLPPSPNCMYDGFIDVRALVTTVFFFKLIFVLYSFSKSPMCYVEIVISFAVSTRVVFLFFKENTLMV